MKKGFTLIELLAVILILGIIALIAVPTIFNIIDNAKKSAAKVSAFGYIDAVEREISLRELGSGYELIIDGSYTVSQLNALNVKIKGESPADDGQVIIVNSIVSYAKIIIKNYEIIYEVDEITSITKNNEVKINSITIGNCSDIQTGDTLDLDVTFNPDNVTNKDITWTTGDELVATVNDGTITGLKAGSTTIVATTNNNKTATCNISITNNYLYNMLNAVSKPVSSYANINAVLNDTTVMSLIIDNNSALTTLGQTYLTDLKANANYNTYVTQLLATIALTNLEKYNLGLPCYLYKLGNFYTDITGGWSSGYAVNGTITVNTEITTILGTAGGWKYAFAKTNNKLALNKYIGIVLYNYVISGSVSDITSRVGNVTGFTVEPAGSYTSTTSVPGYYTVNHSLLSITDDTTNYYVHAGVYGSVANSTAKIQYVYLK